MKEVPSDSGALLTSMPEETQRLPPQNFLMRSSFRFYHQSWCREHSDHPDGKQLPSGGRCELERKLPHYDDRRCNPPNGCHPCLRSCHGIARRRESRSCNFIGTHNHNPVGHSPSVHFSTCTEGLRIHATISFL